MKGIVKAIFGKDASNDKDIVALYEGANKEMCLDLIKFTLTLSMENLSSEEILEKFNNQK